MRMPGCGSDGLAAGTVWALAAGVRTCGVILVGLGLVLLPAARAQSAAPAIPAQVGDTYDAVIVKLGKPTSEITAGSIQLLYYPSAKLKLRNGEVVEITPVAGAAPAPPAAGPPALAAAAGPPAAPGAPGQIRGKKDAVENEIADFEFDVLGRFRKEDYASLEQQAAKLLQERATFGDGTWKIISFHQALQVPASAPEQDWRNVEQRIGRWENAQPKSVTARVAHVVYLIDFAWRARGGMGAAANVPPDQLALFQRRMDQAEAMLATAQGLEQKSPMLWYVGLNLAIGNHWPVAKTVNLYIDGKKYENGFWYLDTTMCGYLSPHWNGHAGEWEQFAATEAQRPGSLGSEGYARVVYAMKGGYRNVFKETQAQWPEAKDGFQVLMQKYPQSLQLVNEYAYLACNAGDREAARGAFDRMGNFVDPFIWTAESLRVLRGWAYQAP